FFRVGRFKTGNELALWILGPQRLALSLFVVGDNGTCRGEDRLGRPIVLFQANSTNPGEVLLKRQNVLNVRASPAVDRLILISHDADVVVRARQVRDQSVLL